MNQIFGPIKIGNMALKNRILRSATHEGMSDMDGRPIKELENLYLKFAKGEVGAIITGFTAIQKNGRPGWNVRMFDDDKYIDDYRKINKKIKNIIRR